MFNSLLLKGRRHSEHGPNPNGFVDESLEDSGQTAESLAKEKRRLFGHLHSFFARDGNDFKYEEVFDDFEFAIETGSDEDYMSLLDRLSGSEIEFNEFSVTKPEAEGGRYNVQFDHDETDNDSASESPMSSINLFPNHSLSEEVNELRKEVALYKSMVHLDHSSFKTKLDGLEKQQHDHSTSSLNKISAIRSRVYSLIFEFYKKSEIKEELTMELPEDAYSFIMYKPWGLAGVTAWMVFYVQVISYFLAVFEKFQVEGDGFERTPVLDLPLGATRLVHASQAIAIFLIFLVNDGLWNSSVQLLNGYNDDLKNADITFSWWLVSNVLRFTEGLAATAVILVLIMLSDNIVTLFKDFTAMTFISSLDDVVFQLAKIAVLGKALKDATECGKDIVVTRTDLMNVGQSYTMSLKSWKYRIRTPLYIIFVIMVTIYALWLYIAFIPQVTGSYLCQKIYIELDDQVNPKLSFFSGTYNIVKNTRLFSRIEYYEERATEEDDEMRIKFDGNKWNFLRKYRTSKSPCVWAKSESVKEEQEFNLFEVDVQKWFASPRPKCPQDDGMKNDTENDMSDLSISLKLTCLDQQPHKHKILDSEADICKKIEIDERKGPFAHAQQWEKAFSILTSEGKEEKEEKIMEVYDHPVYFSTNVIEYQYVVYIGRRWGMFALRKDEVKSPSDFFGEKFHLINANINFTFFSEAVNFKSPGYTGTPVKLQWSLASNPTSDGYQTIEINNAIETNFICSVCGDDNPCFFEGECVHVPVNKTKACKCVTGSSGTLCQVSPTEDGKCDEYFNKIEFDYDGGDCCIESCVSTPAYQCGRDPTGQFFTGYDFCHKRDKLHEGLHWRHVLPSITNIEKVSKISLNPNGQIMAAIRSDTHSVHVYDNDGKQWNIRGHSLKRVENVKESIVQISSHNDVMNSYFKRKSPVTLAVMTSGSVSIFDWDDNIWTENTMELFKNANVEVKQIELRKFGTLIGVLYNNGTLDVFQREDLTSRWYKIRDHLLDRHALFSMSSSGKAYVLANQTSIKLFMEYGTHEVLYTDLGLPIRNVKMSHDGKIVAILQGKPWLEGQITIFDIKGHELVQRQTRIRGIPYADTKIQLNYDGRFVSILLDQSINEIGSNERSFWSYEWNTVNKNWKKVEESKNIIDAAMSESQRVFMLLSESKNTFSNSPLEVYHFHLLCKESGIFHLTINLALHNRGISWELIEIFSKTNWKILKQGGPYPPGSTSFVEDICISEDLKKNESAIVIRVTDLELDGLTPPGNIGISVNGTIKKRISQTIGYQEVIHLLGKNELSLHLSESFPWEKYSFHVHEKCLSKFCEWEQKGQIKKTNGFGGYTHDVFLEMSTPHSISSDGSIIALSRLDSGTYTTQIVSVFKFIDGTKGWVQIGSDISANEESDNFGWSISLSACGHIIAIGDPTSSVKGSNSGRVYVYEFDDEDEIWQPLGSTIDGAENLKMGLSLSLSADGFVVAIGSKNIRSNAEDICNVYVYSYSESTKDWILRGECINSLVPEFKGSKDTYLSLSSSGRFLVVGVPYADEGDISSVGHVSSFQYMISRNSWVKLGETMRGKTEYVCFGYSVSISPDGSDIAISGTTGEFVKVFHYLPQKDSWIQIGKDIATSGPSGVVKVALSSNSKALVVSTRENFFVYMFDQLVDDWILQNHQSEKFKNDNYLSIAVSADALTVAAINNTATGMKKGDSNTIIYRLTTSIVPDDCRMDELFFNFTLKPDSFPRDVTWGIYSQNETISMFRVTDTNDKGIYSYQQCIPNNTLPYTFAIRDSFGDGICCDWGQGYFLLKLNHKVILTHDGFEREKYICLSCLENTSLLRIHFDIKHFEGDELLWSLVSSSHRKISSDLNEFDPFTYGLYVQRNDCLTFGTNNLKGKAYNYSISLAEEILYNEQMDNIISKKYIGNCDSKIIKSCPEGQKLFSLDLYTDLYPNETSWDFNRMNLTKISEYQVNQIIDYESCVSVPQDECTSFVLLDSWGDGGPTYNVTYDGKSHVGVFESAITKIDLSGNCSKIMCDEGQGLFEIDFAKIDEDSFSWKITDDQNTTLVEDRIYVGLKHYYDSVCLPLDMCMTFMRLDDGDRKAKIYRVRWNNTTEKVIELYHFNDKKNNLEFGLCQS